MSGPDTPDYQRGTVAPGIFVGEFTGAELSGTVSPPPNSDVLWIDSAQYGGAIPSVEDADSGAEYPVYLVKGSTGFGTPQFYWVALIEYPATNGIAIEWTSRGAVGWAVFAQAGGRIVYDLAVAAVMGENGTPVGSSLILVGGTDGTDYRALLTDSTGKLLTSGPSFPAIYGPPGAAPPADALYVAGTDGTDLRGLAVDSSGRAETIDQNLKSTVGTPGSADPGEGVQVGGSDGTDFRALFTDTQGRPLVKDFYLALATGGIGAATPNDAVLAGASDGTLLRGIRSNEAGIQYVIPSAPATAASDHPPNELLHAGGFASASVPGLLAAPGAGLRYRVFICQLVVLSSTGAGHLLDHVSGSVFAAGSNLGACMITFPPTGLPLSADAAIDYTQDSGTPAMFIMLGYTIETV